METVFLNPMEAETPTAGQATQQASLDGFLAAAQHKAYHVAYGALWDKETALDVVQESMMRFVEYYRDKPGKEWPALFRTVLNSKINDINENILTFEDIWKNSLSRYGNRVA